jgi:phosphoribosylformylglycinamidine (FGAM) synthase-like enzyme
LPQQKNKVDTESKMKAYDMALKESRQRHQMSIEDKKLENSRKWFWQT